MEKHQIKIEATRKEIKSHGNYAFPVNVSIEHIEAYEQGKFLWHWHPEIELTLILSGKMEYRINDQVYLIEAGQGLFGNSNTLHAGAQIENANCEYLSITFHPRFLYGYEGSVLYQKYVEVITGNSGMGSVLLRSEIGWQAEILQRVLEIYEMSAESQDSVARQDLQSGTDAYELRVHMLLMEIWLRLYQYFEQTPQTKGNVNKSKHIRRLQQMILYLQTHSQEDLTLEDVAEHMNLCKNECCRFFKKNMNMTIVEYLTMLRIQNSLPLLDRGESVTNTANLVGFSSPAYFSQMFKRHMNMSPKDYQKQGIRQG